MALQDAFAHRERMAGGDFRPDPKADRFPEWQAPAASEQQTAKSSRSRSERVALTGVLEDWWREAKAAGRKASTYESYGNTVANLISFLSQRWGCSRELADDAERITPDDVIAFKDHRLASLNPRNGKPISPKTINDSDLSGLKTLFGWAVTNRKLKVNPAAGITIKLGKSQKLRSNGFTDEEAKAILKLASEYQPGPIEFPQTAAAKRWVPWLCAYTGARVGEIAQLRKRDVRQEGGHWVIKITPEAGTVKTDEARDVVLHSHLVEQGFPQFVAGCPDGHLFLRPAKNGDVLGPLQGVKNRLAEFAREAVTDPNVAPNHGWRHRFKTVGLEAGIAPRILDAIQGQAPANVADTYGEVTVKTMAVAIAKLPCYAV